MKFNTPDIEQAYIVSYAIHTHTGVVHACNDESSALQCIPFFCYLNAETRVLPLILRMHMGLGLAIAALAYMCQ